MHIIRLAIKQFFMQFLLKNFLYLAETRYLCNNLLVYVCEWKPLLGSKKLMLNIRSRDSRYFIAIFRITRKTQVIQKDRRIKAFEKFYLNVTSIFETKKDPLQNIKKTSLDHATPFYRARIHIFLIFSKELLTVEWIFTLYIFAVWFLINIWWFPILCKVIEEENLYPRQESWRRKAFE